ncbi:MAG: hypothetical protein IJV65_02990 [Kiritimatiellae bacterium]|nr:hypothetical protein [Kiritimatiellia bacterium]
MKRPAFLVAAGLFVPGAIGLLFHLFLHWTYLSGLRWPTAHADALGDAGLALLALSGAAIVVGLSRLLRDVFRVPWIGAAAWALAGVGSALWPFVALLPAARRLGNRPAARLAAWGGAVFLLAPALGTIGRFADAPVFWPLLAVGVGGTWLVLAALRALDGGARPHRALARAFALVVLVSLATQPALHAGRVRRQADAAFAALVERVGSPVRPETFRFPPPVAEADDPLAAFDADAIDADEASLTELRTMLLSSSLPVRRHPFAPEELAAAAAWLASHTNLMAAADAMSDAPGYRSCLPGPASFEDVARQGFQWFEPRLFGSLSFANALAFRARFARAGGADEDGDAGLDEARRLENIAALHDREAAVGNLLLAASIRGMETGAINVRIDRWSDDGLRAMQRAAEDAAERFEGRFRDAFAGGLFRLRATIGNVEANAIAAASPSVRASRALDYWTAAELRDLCRLWNRTWDALDGLLAAAASEDDFPREAFDRLAADEKARADALPPLTKLMAGHLVETARDQLVQTRDRAAFVRTAVAVERYRRANGAPPPSLDALVPAFLPAVPRAARTGAPFAYEPGPLEIPDEILDALRDPDEAAAQSKAEFRARFSDAEAITVGQMIDAINEEIRNGDAPDPDTRTLPAQTLPGFRLTIPSYRGRPELDAAVDFVTQREPEPRAESAEGAEPAEQP